MHILRMHQHGGGGLSPQPNALNSGLNSGYQAVGLAIATGVSRVVLLGYDMQFTGGRSHHHAGHPDKTPEDWYKVNFALEFKKLAKQLPSGVEVINASRETSLTCFKRMSIEEALQ